MLNLKSFPPCVVSKMWTGMFEMIRLIELSMFGLSWMFPFEEEMGPGYYLFLQVSLGNEDGTHKDNRLYWPKAADNCDE